MTLKMWAYQLIVHLQLVHNNELIVQLSFTEYIDRKTKLENRGSNNNLHRN